MYYSSEEEINDDVSSDSDRIDGSGDGDKSGQPIIPLDRIELGKSDTKRIATERGVIWLSFPKALKSQINDQFPRTYTSTTSKERLLLLFAENFRRQFNVLYKHRRPLILAVANEAGVQKFVSTTIRNTALLFADLVGTWEGPAQFVADFIEFQILLNPITMPDRLMSPDTLLRCRKGNSFEMATLLCSLLLGNGFLAMVVSGYATREVVNNNQERVECPCIPKEEQEEIVEVDTMKNSIQKNKYALRDRIDLRSRFELEMADRRAKEREQQKQKQLVIDQKEREILERLPPDEYHGWRVHAWVVVLPKVKPLKNIASDVQPQTDVFFIESTTGFRVLPGDPVYLGIESVWDHNNYYVNCQEPISDIASMTWDFNNLDHWQTLLVTENCGAPKSGNDDSTLNESIHKFLDMPHSWVVRPHVSNTAFEERFPTGHKTIRYKRAIYDRYQNYFNTDGLMKQLTLYETLDYEGKLNQWQWYENRNDLMNMIRIDFVQQRTDHYFDKGRPDKLKQTTYPDAIDQPVEFYFYSQSRIDALDKLEWHREYVREKFGDRQDRLITREFHIETDESGECKKLIRVCETYRRNSEINARDDIYMRTFDLKNGFITLQFHYGHDEITPTIRVFKRPPKPDYGCEIIYNFNDPNTNQFNKKEHLSRVQQYLLLLEQLRMEEMCQKEFKLRSEFITELRRIRKDEIENPILTFSLFDPLRNGAARSLRLSRQEQLERRKELALKSDPDYVAPYLIRYSNRMPTASESEIIMNACLQDIETEYRHVLDELVRSHDDQALEEESLRKFLNKFQRQFEDFEYEMLVKQGERIESNKRVLKQRIDTVHQEFQEKYETVKQSILNDKRLYFHDESNGSDRE